MTITIISTDHEKLVTVAEVNGISFRVRSFGATDRVGVLVTDSSGNYLGAVLYIRGAIVSRHGASGEHWEVTGVPEGNSPVLHGAAEIILRGS